MASMKVVLFVSVLLILKCAVQCQVVATYGSPCGYPGYPSPYVYEDDRDLDILLPILLLLLSGNNCGGSCGGPGYYGTLPYVPAALPYPYPYLGGCGFGGCGGCGGFGACGGCGGFGGCGGCGGCGCGSCGGCGGCGNCGGCGGCGCCF